MKWIINNLSSLFLIVVGIFLVVKFLPVVMFAKQETQTGTLTRKRAKMLVICGAVMVCGGVGMMFFR